MDLSILAHSTIMKYPAVGVAFFRNLTAHYFAPEVSPCVVLEDGSVAPSTYHVMQTQRESYGKVGLEEPGVRHS